LQGAPREVIPGSRGMRIRERAILGRCDPAAPGE
jgi:hypothetical protein